MAESIRVLIADGQGPYRTGLSSILSGDGAIKVVGETGSGPEAADKALEVRPNVILVDPFLPNSCGVQPMFGIRDRLPSVCIVVLTASEREEDVSEALSCGAQGYLLKSSSTAEILEAVKRVAAGGVILSPSIASKLVRGLRQQNGRPKLSSREKEVLALLGEGLSNLEIADRLVVSQSTVRTYVDRLLSKLNLKNRREATAYAAQHYTPLVRIAEGLRTADLAAVDKVAPPLVVPSQGGGGTTAAPATGAEPVPSSPPRDETTGERKQATALSIRLQQACAAPKGTEAEDAEVMFEYLDLVVDVARRYGGVVTWLSENGCVALFGVPASQEHGPQKALQAALAAQASVKERMEQFGHADHQVHIRIGVSTGPVVARQDSDGTATRYIPVGLTTEMAARAMDMVEPGAIAVSESTFRLTRDLFEFEPVGRNSPSGLTEAIPVYRLLGLGPAMDKMAAAKLRGLTTFVGRRKEMRALKRAFAEAKSGKGQVVGIIGEAGIGKSRLILQFQEQLAGEQCLFFKGACISHGMSMAYLPWLQVMRLALGVGEGEDAAVVGSLLAKEVERLDEGLRDALLPLRDILGLPPDDRDYQHLSPPQRKERLFEAAKALLIRASQERPMVVVLDDLLWIDKSSEELLSQVIDVVAGARILLILAYRPDYVHSWASKPFYNQVRVDQLPLADSRQMVEHVLGFEGSSHDVIDLTVQRTQGNPLYIEEFVDALKESGTVRKAGDSRALSAAVSEAAIPAAVQTIVADRIDRLEPGARQVLQVASAIGTEFSIGLLQDAMQVKDAMGLHLRELQSLGFIYQASVFSDPTWVFRHVLTRDVAYVSLTSAARRRIHQRIGQSIEERHAERLAEFYEVLAHHFALSHDWQRACRYLKLAAGRAARNFSNWEALQLYKDALEICSRRKETPECRGERLAIRLEMDAVLRCLDYPDGSLENLKAARREAVELSDFRAEALVHSKIGWYYSFRGRTAFGLRHTRASFVQAMKTKDISLVVPISLDLCLSYMAMGNLSLVADVASPAILLLEEQGHESEYSSGLHHANLYCELLSYLGLGLASIGEIERGKDACARALEVAYRVDQPASIGLCLHFSGHTFWAQGDWKSVVKCQRRAIRFLSKAGSSIPLGACWGNLGVAYAMLGKHNAAAECVDRGLRIHAEGGAAAFTSNFYWARGIVELNEGNIGNARCAFEESLSLAETYGQMFAQGTASMYLGRTRSQGKLGASNEARKSILRGMNIFHRLHLEPFYTQGLLFLGEHYASVGDKKNALRNLKKAEGLFTQMGMDYWLKKTQEALRTL